MAGQRYDAFFQNSVYGTKTIDFAPALAYAGLALSNDPATTDGTLGAAFSTRTGKLLVTGVVRDGAAWADGLNVNDEILLVNGTAPTAETVNMLLSGPVGTAVALQVRRDGLPRDLKLTMRANPARKFQIQPMPNPTPAQQKVLAAWLGLKN